LHFGTKKIDPIRGKSDQGASAVTRSDRRMVAANLDCIVLCDEVDLSLLAAFSGIPEIPRRRQLKLSIHN
jgi:hypothetical protein